MLTHELTVRERKVATLLERATIESHAFERVVRSSEFRIEVMARELYNQPPMMSRRTIRIVAIVLAVLVALTTILGYEANLERQHIPPAYSRQTLDV